MTQLSIFGAQALKHSSRRWRSRGCTRSRCWQNQAKPELKAEGDSLCTMEIERSGTAVKLSITHSVEREPSKFIDAVSGGWPKVISNLKSLLETGSAVLQDPYPNPK
jgi:hypothetical protein